MTNNKFENTDLELSALHVGEFEEKMTPDEFEFCTKIQKEVLKELYEREKLSVPNEDEGKEKARVFANNLLTKDVSKAIRNLMRELLPKFGGFDVVKEDDDLRDEIKGMVREFLESRSREQN